MSDNSFVRSRQSRGDGSSKHLIDAREAEEAIRNLHLTQQQLLELEERRLEAEHLRLEEERDSREEARARAERYREIRSQLAALELDVKTFENDLSRGKLLEKKLDGIALASHRFAVIRAKLSQLALFKRELDDLADIRFFAELEYSVENLVSLHPHALGTTAVRAAVGQIASLAYWTEQATDVEGQMIAPSTVHAQCKGFQEDLPESLEKIFETLVSLESVRTLRDSAECYLAQAKLVAVAYQKRWEEVEPFLEDLHAVRVGAAELTMLAGQAPPALELQVQSISNVQEALSLRLDLLSQAEIAWRRDKGFFEEAIGHLESGRFGDAEKAVAKAASRQWQDIHFNEIGSALNTTLEDLLAESGKFSGAKAIRVLKGFLGKYSDSEILTHGLEARLEIFLARRKARYRAARILAGYGCLLLAGWALVKSGPSLLERFAGIILQDEALLAAVHSKGESGGLNEAVSELGGTGKEQPPADSIPKAEAVLVDKDQTVASVLSKADGAPQGSAGSAPEVPRPYVSPMSAAEAKENQAADKAAFSAQFKRIPAGSFQMGELGDVKSPVSQVLLDEFYISVTEVTFEDWKTVKAWAETAGYSFEHSGNARGNNHPVNEVSWYDAVKWCNAKSEKAGLAPCYYTSAARNLSSVYRDGVNPLTPEMIDRAANGYRLPTEAEWEKAARGGVSGRKFPNGHALSSREANYSNVGGNTLPVKYYIPNPYGLYEMAGNVMEWCEDLCPASANADGSLSLPPRVNSERAVRGGSWTDPRPENCRVSYRSGHLAESISNSKGFRVVRRGSP